MKTRNVIEGVPKVAFAPIHDGKFEFTPFPSCLKAVCRFLGNDVDYRYLLGASGAAFRLVWHKHRWEGGNVDIFFMDTDPLKPHRRGLEAAGFEYEIILNGTVRWESEAEQSASRYLGPVLSNDEELFRRKIVASIDEGKPVIAFGVVGPPEASIISGYDDEGDTLVGWSMFQDHLDPVHDLVEGADDELSPPSGMEESGYFRRDDWFGRTYGIITLGAKREVDSDAVYRDALEWIPEIVQRRSVYEFYTGLAAYDAYIEKLLSDTEYPADDMKTLALRKMVHYDAMTMIAERDGGSQFVRDAAAREVFAPIRSDLDAAADLFKAANGEMESWWKIVGQIWSDEEAQIRATADPRVRRAFAGHVRDARGYDAEAAERISAALGRLD